MFGCNFKPVKKAVRRLHLSAAQFGLGGLRQTLPLLQLPLPLAASGAATVLVDKFDAGRSKARSREDGTTLNQFIVSARGLALGWWQVSERIPSK